MIKLLGFYYHEWKDYLELQDSADANRIKNSNVLFYVESRFRGLLQRIEIEKSAQRSHYFSSPNFSAPQDEFVLVEETISAQEDGYPGQPLLRKAGLLPKSLAREEELREHPSVRCVYLRKRNILGELLF
jgi:hypothetical protein